MIKKKEKCVNIITMLYAMTMSLLIVYGIYTLIYFDTFLSLAFLIPIFLISGFVFFSLKSLDIDIVSIVRIKHSKFNLPFMILNGVGGFSILPLIYYIFNDPINLKTIFLSVVLGIWFMIFPLLISNYLLKDKNLANNSNIS